MLADYQNHSENFSLGFFRTRQEPSPLAAACLLSPGCVFRHHQGQGEPGTWDPSGASGTGLGVAALPCSALLSSTCFFFPGFLFSAIYLGLARFGGEPAKGFGQCRAPPHPLGQHVQFRGLSWSRHPCPARHGPCLSHPAPSVSFCTSHSAPPSVRPSVCLSPHSRAMLFEVEASPGTVIFARASQPPPTHLSWLLLLIFPPI